MRYSVHVTRVGRWRWWCKPCQYGTPGVDDPPIAANIPGFHVIGSKDRAYWKARQWIKDQEATPESFAVSSRTPPDRLHLPSRLTDP